MRNRLNKLPLFLILAIVTIVFASCKQTVVINEAVFLDSPADKGNLWGFVESNLINCSFYIWLLIDFVAAFLIWTNGYKVLEWLRKRPMPVKIVLILATLATLFVLGCNSYDGEAHYGSWFALPVSVAIGSTCVLAWAIIQRYKVRFKSLEDRPVIPEAYRRQRNLVLLAKTMLWIWCCGWVMFFVAISIGRQPHVGAEVLLRSAIASLDLFLMDIDSNTLDAIQSHDVLKGMISCASFAAVLCTATLIMSLVLSRLMAYMHIKHIKIDNNHNHIYLFFGMNDASKLLAKDVYEKDASSVILFVVNSLAGESEQDEDKTDGWKNIVSMMIHRHKTFVEVDENERRALAIANCDICSLDSESTDVLGTIGLQTVKSLLRTLETTDDGKLHIFFLSEDSEHNVRSTSVLAKDELIKSLPTIIYCHARRNGLNRILEDIAFKSGLEVRTIDSSAIAVEQLKADEANQPVHFVDIDDKNPTTVKSAFNSLIVGFDEVGRDALKFLYEFGAFVDRHSTPEDVRRSPFHCIAVDRNMKAQEGSFANFAPAVMKQKNSNYLPLVELKQCDCQSKEFYDEILTTEFCTTVNYIVVAVGDDELGMTLAIRMLNHIRRVRADLSKLAIFVRCYHPDKEIYLQKIATYYNDSYNNNFAKEDEALKNNVIRLFGQYENIYSYDMIVNDKITKDGKVYQESYEHIKGSNVTWKDRRKKLQTEGTLDSIRKMRRQEFQDISNALHADTKLFLLKQAMPDCDWQDFLSRYFNSGNMPNREGSYGDIKYPKLSPDENEIILNLACLEHIRWIASHEMLGYTPPLNPAKYDHGCNERTREHNCIRPWQELDAESRIVTETEGWTCDYKIYDFIVVDNSILLNKETLLNRYEYL